MPRWNTEILWYTKFKPGLLGNHVYLLITLIFHHNTCANLPFKKKLYFSVRSNFIWLRNTKTCIFTHFVHKMNTKAVFSQVAVATSENISFGVHEWNKIWSYTEKSKFSVSFMLLFTIIKFLPAFRLSFQQTNIFLAISRQFGLVQHVYQYTIGRKHRKWA